MTDKRGGLCESKNWSQKGKTMGGDTLHGMERFHRIQRSENEKNRVENASPTRLMRILLKRIFSDECLDIMK